jgi:N-acetylmuramoyl-L-alanine amidase
MPLVLNAEGRGVGVIVLDPGHGGDHKVGDSSPNNATSPSGVLEKNITLDLCKRIRLSTTSGLAAQHALQKGKTVQVVMTREKDENVGLADRAAFAADNSASVYLSIHFNADKGQARGTECWIDRKYMQPVQVTSTGDTIFRDGPGLKASGLRNVNVKDDERFAQAVATAAVTALRTFDADAKLRKAVYTAKENGEAYAPPAGVKMKGLGTLRDASLGTSSNKCVAGLLEVDFLDNQDFDKLWNGAKGPQVRDALANGVAIVLVDFA